MGRGVFSRQLLALGTYLEVFQEIRPQWRKALPRKKAQALETYLAFAFSKVANYNSRMSIWHPLRVWIANTFDRHDFSFKWSHAEMIVMAEGKGFDWAVSQVVDAFKGLAELLTPAQKPLFKIEGQSPPLN